MRDRFWPRCPQCSKDLAKDHWRSDIFNCINMDCPLYYRKYASKGKQTIVILNETGTKLEKETRIGLEAVSEQGA